MHIFIVDDLELSNFSGFFSQLTLSGSLKVNHKKLSEDMWMYVIKNSIKICQNIILHFKDCDGESINNQIYW